jgi:hypothetical protein
LADLAPDIGREVRTKPATPAPKPTHPELDIDTDFKPDRRTTRMTCDPAAIICSCSRPPPRCGRPRNLSRKAKAPRSANEGSFPPH